MTQDRAIVTFQVLTSREDITLDAEIPRDGEWHEVEVPGVFGQNCHLMASRLRMDGGEWSKPEEMDGAAAVAGGDFVFKIKARAT